MLGVMTAVPSFARQADREGGRYVGSRSVAAGVIEWRADHVVDSQTGVAAVYEASDHHRRTSSGERYDRFAMTAAHPRYQFDSMVRVTNLQTGRRIVVRVNDRLRGGTGAVVRLSESAAGRLELDYSRGSAEGDVRIELLSSETVPAVEVGTRRSKVDRTEGRFRYRVSDDRPVDDRPVEERPVEERPVEKRPVEERPDEEYPVEERSVTSIRNGRDTQSTSADQSVGYSSDDSFTLQIGAFSTLGAARRLAADVEGAWVMQVVEGGERVYRVYFGQFETEKKARAAQDRLKKKGRDSFLRTVPS